MKLKITVLLLTLILISGCSITGSFVNIVNCVSFDANKADECYINIAKQKNDIVFCNVIRDPSSVEYCYTEVAQATNNINICSQIKGMYWHDICTKKIALATGNPKYCTKLREVTDGNECMVVYEYQIKTYEFITDVRDDPR